MGLYNWLGLQEKAFKRREHWLSRVEENLLGSILFMYYLVNLPGSCACLISRTYWGSLPVKSWKTGHYVILADRCSVARVKRNCFFIVSSSACGHWGIIYHYSTSPNIMSIMLLSLFVVWYLLSIALSPTTINSPCISRKINCKPFDALSYSDEPNEYSTWL